MSAAIGFLALVLMATSPSGASASESPQTFSVSQWRVESGLPSDVVTALAQDQHNFLWIGTDAGLARFDGGVFTAVAPLAGQEVISLVVQGNVVWVALRTQICRVDSDAFANDGTDATSCPLPLKAPPCGDIKTMIAGPAKQLLVGTSCGVWQMQNEELNVLRSPSPALATLSMMMDRQSNLWLARAGGVEVVALDGTRPVKFIALPSSVATAAIADITEDANGDVWIGTAGNAAALVKVDGRGDTSTFGRADGLPVNQVARVAVAADNTVWFATRSGLATKIGSTFSRVVTAPLLTARADALLHGRDATVWVGSRGAGLFRLMPARFSVQDQTTGLPGDAVTALATDSEGDVWGGTRGRGVFVVRGQRLWRAWPGPIGDIRALWLDRQRVPSSDKGDMPLVALADFPGRIFRLRDPVGWEIMISDPSLGVVSALRASREGQLWAGGHRGLFTIGPKRTVHKHAAVGGREVSLVTTLFEDSQSRMLVGTQTGLLIVTKAGSMRSPALEGMAIEAVGETNVGDLWVATRSGLFTAVGSHEFIKSRWPSDFVCGFAAGPNGALWASTAKGLMHVCTDETCDVTPYAFAREDGLPSSSCQPGGAVSAVGGDGTLWFSLREAGLAGVIAAQGPLQAAPVRLGGVNYDGVSVPSLAVVPSAVRVIDFELFAPLLTAGRSASIKYRLRGVDDNWRNASRTAPQVRFVNLSAGQYRLEAGTANEMGQMGPVRAILFSVAPAWYYRAWFWALVVVALALAAWRLLRLREHTIHARHAAVLAERGRVARELHDTLLQGFSAIVYRMHAIRKIVQRSPAQADAELRATIDLAGQELGKTRRAIMDIRAPHLIHSPLATVLTEGAREAAGSLALKLSVEPELPDADARTKESLLRILQELIKNVAAHANATQLEVGVSVADHGFVLTVKDDGIGFRPPRFGVEPFDAHHFGLRGVYERTRAAGGSLSVASEHAQGTIVTVCWPTAVQD